MTRAVQLPYREDDVHVGHGDVVEALDVDVAAGQDLALPHVGGALDGGHLVLLVDLWGTGDMCISVCISVRVTLLDCGQLVLLVGLWGTGTMCINVCISVNAAVLDGGQLVLLVDLWGTSDLCISVWVYTYTKVL